MSIQNWIFVSGAVVMIAAHLLAIWLFVKDDVRLYFRRRRRIHSDS